MKVDLNAEYRFWGGCGSLHFYSPDIPGLHLCGSDPEAVFGDIEAAVKFLMLRVYGTEWEDWRSDLPGPAEVVRDIEEKGFQCANPALAKQHRLASWKWAAKLREHGCTLAAGDEVFCGESQMYVIWQTSWGHKFMAPLRCTFDEAEQIIGMEVTRRFVAGVFIPEVKNAQAG